MGFKREINSNGGEVWVKYTTDIRESESHRFPSRFTGPGVVDRTLPRDPQERAVYLVNERRNMQPKNVKQALEVQDRAGNIPHADATQSSLRRVFGQRRNKT